VANTTLRSPAIRSRRARSIRQSIFGSDQVFMGRTSSGLRRANASISPSRPTGEGRSGYTASARATSRASVIPFRSSQTGSSAQASRGAIGSHVRHANEILRPATTRCPGRSPARAHAATTRVASNSSDSASIWRTSPPWLAQLSGGWGTRQKSLCHTTVSVIPDVYLLARRSAFSKVARGRLTAGGGSGSLSRSGIPCRGAAFGARLGSEGAAATLPATSSLHSVNQW
jgi:hypothetical protein